MKNLLINMVIGSMLLFCPYQGFAQNKFQDSLRRILQKQPKDTNRVNTLNELAYDLYMSSKYDSSILCGNQALLLSEKLNYQKGKGYALLYIGCNYSDKYDQPKADSFYRQASLIAHEIKDKKLTGLVYHSFGGGFLYANNFVEAFKYYDSAMQIYVQVGDKRLIALIMRIYGMMYNYQSNYPEALRYTGLALKYFEEIRDEEKMAECYGFTGDVYKEHRNFTESLKNYIQAISIYRKLLNSTDATSNSRLGLFRVTVSLGEVYLLQRDPQKALNTYTDLLKEVTPLVDKKDDAFQIDFNIISSDCYIGIGSVAELKGDLAKESGNLQAASDHFEEAEQNYQRSLKICQDINTEVQSPKVCIRLGSINLKLSNYAVAEKWLQTALQIATANGLPLIERDSYLDLSKLYEETGNFEKAHHHYQKYILYRDSIVNEESIRKTEGYKMQVEFDKKQAIAKAEQQRRDSEIKRTKKIQYLTIAFLAILVLAILIIALIQWRNNKQKQRANLLLQDQKQKIETTLNDLKATQTQLIHSEKMASLGELTAGIAHEIQNPLNFVNNFSEVSTELIKEMVDEVDKGNTNEAKEIAADLVQNLEKINHHGKRADAIVKGMLQHSRTSSGQKELTDINALCDEYLRLSYHGLRAKDKSFNATLKTDFDETIGKINIIPQDIGRVILNLITNAFYAVSTAQTLKEGMAYVPTVNISTKKVNGKVEIRVGDNGTGIPKNIVDKIFQPFFTTKPTGQGTGLGLSLSYDIIKAHGGELKVETKENEGSTFIIQLPVV
ncbi:MAG: tetratricopeptide repeat protein [Ferruginibacter sp.]